MGNKKSTTKLPEVILPKVQEKVKPGAEPKPQHEIDIHNLQLTVEHLEKRDKQHSEQVHLMKAMCESCQWQIKKLKEDLKKVSDVAGAGI
jgi:archaellum component FlaC